jgi:hypothetical protein
LTAHQSLSLSTVSMALLTAGIVVFLLLLCWPLVHFLFFFQIVSRSRPPFATNVFQSSRRSLLSHLT